MLQRLVTYTGIETLMSVVRNGLSITLQQLHFVAYKKHPSLQCKEHTFLSLDTFKFLLSY